MDMITLAMAKAYSDSQRIGYVESDVVIFDAALEDTGGGASAAQVDIIIELEVGKKYTVITDSGSYTAAAKALYGSTLYLGNAGLLNPELDTGETFCVIATTTYTVAGDINCGSHITVTTAETIHTIDPKYLPDTVATKADILGAMEASY